jgi:hypothetical protein
VCWCCSAPVPHITKQAWDLVSLCNGVLVGFVAITACAHVVEPWAAIINGAIGGLVSQAADACRVLMMGVGLLRGAQGHQAFSLEKRQHQPSTTVHCNEALLPAFLPAVLWVGINQHVLRLTELLWIAPPSCPYRSLTVCAGCS